MTHDNTLARSLHDLGAAAWFGGSLMGAVGVNGGAAEIEDPRDRSRVAAAGWARWAPVSAAAIAAHAIGGVGLLRANRLRIKHQDGVGANTLAKSAITVAAAGTTLYSGILGARIAAGGKQHTASATEPSSRTSQAVADAQRQQRILQWVTPVLTGAVVVLGAVQGEQQRPARIVSGLFGS